MLAQDYAKVLCWAMAASCCTTAAFAGDADPHKMGYQQVRHEEAATVALLAQRFARGLASGDPYLYLNFIADDFTESTAARAAANAHAGFLKTAAWPPLTPPGAPPRLTEVQVNGGEAVVAMLQETAGTRALQARLYFEKRPEGWRLVRAEGLLALAHAATQTLAKPVGAGYAVALVDAEESATRTFIASDLSTDHHIAKLTRALTRERLQRNLFSLPYGTAFFARLQQFDNAPFVAASYVQLATDPAWNRIVYGDYQKWIKAYDGKESGMPLQRPHGIAVDAKGLVYVADTGNRRVRVLKLSGPADELVLSQVGELGGNELAQPTEIAWDDRGTIFNSADDLVWVIDRGTNTLLAYRANAFSAVPILSHSSEAYVALAALAVGHFEGRSDGNIYLADAGTRRLLRYYFDGNTLFAVNSVNGDAEAVPAGLATDYWGNVYLADASYRRLQKFSTDLTPLATLQPEDETFQPIRFQPLFGSVTKPGEAAPSWSGYDQAFLLEQWSENSGARRFGLGIDFALTDLRWREDLATLSLAGKLTDTGHLKADLLAAQSGVVAQTLYEDWNNAGAIRVDYDRRNFAGEMIAPGYYKLRYTMQSTYDRPPTLRDSEAFYVPLYYYEDCGATAARDAHLLRGTRRIDFGTAPERSVVTDPQMVCYRFAGLNSTVAYEAKAEFFAARGEVEQAFYADQNMLQQMALAAAQTSATGWLAIPAAALRDGELELRVLKTSGSGEASVAEIWLREAAFDAAHPPQPAAATLPQQLTLEQNYPNPFNPSTTIAFSLPPEFQGTVSLRIYNMLGEVVRELVQRELAAGNYREVWDGRDTAGRLVTTGVYVYQLRAGSFTATRKLVMMK